MRLICSLGAFPLAAVVVTGFLGLPGTGASNEIGQEPSHRLKDDRAELLGSWIYDDVDAGFAEAKKSGKPLMIVFR